MKKLLTLLLAACLLLGMIPAAAGAEDDWVTLRVEMYDRSTPGFNVEDCWQLHYIQEHFGDPNHIKVVWVPVSRWEEGEILSRLLAGGEAPDLCMTYGTPNLESYIADGGIKALDELMAEYGPDIAPFLGDEVLEYGKFDADDGRGKLQYYIPACRIIVATQSAYIRGDWLEKLGMEVPANIEELYAYLKAAKEANLGGAQTIPYASDLYPADPFYGWIYQMDQFIDYSQVTEEDWIAYHDFHYLLPGAKEAIRWMNKFYNEGLVTEYFGLNNSEQTDADRVQGYDGFWFGNWDVAWRQEYLYSQDLAKNVPGAYYVACDPYKPVDGPTVHETYNANGQALFIPESASDEAAAAAIKYLNWMVQPESLFALQNGEKGYTYTTVDENGIPTDLKNISDTEDAYKIHAVDGCPICNGFFYGSDELNYAASANAYPGYEAEVAHSLAIANDGGYQPVTYTRAITARVDYGTTVLSKEADLLVNAVTCKTEDFDAVWEQYTQEILNNGGQEIIDEQRAAYQEGAYRGTYPMGK